jgi:hypothetical protein
MSATGHERPICDVRSMSASPESGHFHYGLLSNSGSFATFEATRRASSRVSNLAADLRPGSSSKFTYASAYPLLSRTMKQATVSSTVHGGGKRRGAYLGSHGAPRSLESC